MIYVGLDVHKEYSRVGMFDPATGELADLGDVPSRPEAIAEVLSRIAEPKCVVLEAGRSSHFVAAALEPFAAEVWLVHPARVRALQKQSPKTDAHDAAGMAFWAAKGALTPIWRPSAATLDLRELTRGKTALVRMATRVRCMLRSLLARHGYECPFTDLLGQKAQAWLNAVSLAGYAGQMLATLRQLLPIIQQAAEQFEQPIEAEAARHPGAQRLATIPGIGPFLGLALAVEIDDVHRFATPCKLRGYSGLDPRVVQSGAKDSRGPLTKRGNRWLRYAAVLAAQSAATRRRSDPKLKRSYLSVSFRRGCNPAKVHCARLLLDLCHHLLWHEETYQPRPLRG
jgi:transposase